MKLKSLKKKEKTTPSVQEYIDLIQCLFCDIQAFEQEIPDCDWENYKGILSTRTAPLLKKLFPKVYNKLDVE